MLIVMIALSGASVTATGVQTSPVQNVESQNVTEVSVNPVPTVSNSKQRRQYRLAYVSWKNRIADLRMSALNWLEEYYLRQRMLMEMACWVSIAMMPLLVV